MQDLYTKFNLLALQNIFDFLATFGRDRIQYHIHLPTITVDLKVVFE